MPNRRGGHLRLVRSLHGEGAVLWGVYGERPVTYAVDLDPCRPKEHGDAADPAPLAAEGVVVATLP